MNDPQPKPKTTLEQLREIRDAQLKEVESLDARLKSAKAELKKLDKAVQMWEPKE